jgi:hypothetical protein
MAPRGAGLIKGPFGFEGAAINNTQNIEEDGSDVAARKNLLPASRTNPWSKLQLSFPAKK